MHFCRPISLSFLRVGSNNSGNIQPKIEGVGLNGIRIPGTAIGNV